MSRGRRITTPRSISVLSISWLLWMPACDADSSRRALPPNVLIVTFDTLRADHTSLASPKIQTTPNLVRLAEQGIEFTEAYAPSATTGPSHASLFTGLYPGWHAVVKNGIPLAAEHTTMAEWFRDQGYQTAAFVSSFVLNHRFGFDQGFDTYDDRFASDSSTLQIDEWEGLPIEDAFDRTASATTHAVLAWLAEDRDEERPFMVFVHYFDPHAPYLPPGEFAASFGARLDRPADLAESIRRYDAEIAFADQQLGRVLDALKADGQLDDTLVIVTADHGEGLMDHGVMEHGALLYEPFVRVPLVMRLPGRQREPRRIDTPVSLVDLLRTTRRLVMTRDVNPEPSGGAGAGRDLSDWLIPGTEAPPMAPIYFHRRPYTEGRIDAVDVVGERFAIRSGSWKYLSRGDGGPPELYDLSSDAKEKNDQSEEIPNVARDLEEALETWREGFPVDEAGEVPARVRRMLEELGYVD